MSSPLTGSISMLVSSTLLLLSIRSSIRLAGVEITDVVITGVLLLHDITGAVVKTSDELELVVTGVGAAVSMETTGVAGAIVGVLG